jgi:hypothetical protein
MSTLEEPRFAHVADLLGSSAEPSPNEEVP